MLNIESIHGGVKITRLWFSFDIVWQALGGYVGGYLLVMTLNGFMLLAPEKKTLVGEILASLLFAGAYLWLTGAMYLGLVQTLINRTIVIATSTQLTVRHVPIPGEGRFHFRKGDILQLYCVQAPGWWFGLPRWDLIAVLKENGRQVTLIRRRPFEELMIIEHHVEQALGIVDVPRTPEGVKPTMAALHKSVTDPLLPTQLQKEESEDRLVLSWSWFNVSASVIFGLLLLALYFSGAEVRLLSKLWVGTCAAVLLYFTLVLVFNRTYVSVVRGGMLAVRHGPLPALSGVTVSTRHVSQLFVHTDAITGTTRVFALLKGGKRVTLAKAPNAEIAVEIERSVEQWLGIKDVSGSTPALRQTR